jgi:excisionase family DNA binding protein
MSEQNPKPTKIGPVPDDRLRTKNFAALTYDCHLSTINRFIADGTLKSVKIGHMRRIRQSEIDRLINASEVS